MNRFEIQLKALETKMQERVDEYKAIYKKADDEKRNLDEQEQGTVVECHRALETLKEERELVKSQLAELKAVDDLGRSLGPAVPSTDMRVARGGEPLDRLVTGINKSLGEQFTDNASFKNMVSMYRETGRIPQGFSTGPIGFDMKGTLGETAGSGGGALANTVPQVVPGVVEKYFQSLTFADLVLSGQATTSSIRYVVEGTATSGAAGVAEAGSKPESTLGLTTTDEPIKKIATLLPVSEEMIQDAPAIQSYINGRLSLFVKIEEERQLLRGTSGGNEVQGMLTSRSIPVYAGTVTDTKADQLFKAMNGMRGSAFVEPEWIIMHPTDWQTIRLLKDGTGGTAGQYFGGGPFFGPYGGPQGPAGANAQVQGPQDSIWNKPVYVTAAIGGAGTALVGTRAGAQVWRRGGLTVEASNSHSTYFQLNLIAIRAEERLGLAVYRPGAYVEVRLA